MSDTAGNFPSWFIGIVVFAAIVIILGIFKLNIFSKF